MAQVATSQRVRSTVFDLRWNSININTPTSITLQQYLDHEHDGIDIEYFGGFDVLAEEALVAVELDISVDVLASYKEQLEQELSQSFPDMDVDEMMEYLTWQEVSADMSLTVFFTLNDFSQWIRRPATEDEPAELHDDVITHCYHEAYQLFRGMFRERVGGTAFNELILPALDPLDLRELVEDDEGGILRLDADLQPVAD